MITFQLSAKASGKISKNYLARLECIASECRVPFARYRFASTRGADINRLRAPLPSTTTPDPTLFKHQTAPIWAFNGLEAWFFLRNRFPSAVRSILFWFETYKMTLFLSRYMYSVYVHPVWTPKCWSFPLIFALGVSLGVLKRSNLRLCTHNIWAVR